MAFKLSVLAFTIPALLSAAAIEGIVRDPSGAAVPGAAIVLKNSETAQAENALTDTQGHFAFADVPPGKYTVTIRHEGFEDIEKAIDAAGTPLALAFTMKIATQETVVEVGGKRCGSVTIANSDAGWNSYTHEAIDQAWRAVNELKST